MFVFGRFVQRVAIITALLSYPVLAHYSTFAPSADFGTMLGLSPFLLIALALAWKSSFRVLLFAGCGVAIALVFSYWEVLQHHYCWMYFIQNVATNLGLGLFFGRTLFKGQRPLCTIMASHFHPTLSQAMLRYTRQVTIAWTFYFTLMVITSSFLFFLAPIEVWSVFANFLTPLFVVLVFLGEYAIRLRKLPADDRGTLFGALKAYRQFSPSSYQAIKQKNT